MIKFITQLFNKYVRNECTEEEKQVVENWINDTEPEESSLSAEALTDIKAEMWKEISAGLPSETPSEKTSVISLDVKVIQYMAAACVVIGVLVFSVVGEENGTSASTSSIAYDNLDGKDTKLIQTAGMNFSLLPSSTLNFTTNDENTKNEINICGKLKIENKQENIHLRINSGCIESEKLSVTVKLRKNKKYYVFQHINREGKEELFVLDNKDLVELYPPIRMQLEKNFHI